MNWLACTVTFLVAAIVTVALLPFAKWLSKRTGAIDYPSARRVNKKPIPRLGGVAIYGGIISSFVTIAIGIAFFGWDNPFTSYPDLNINYVGVVISVFFMFAVGLVDDIKGLNPKIKFLGQVIAASIAAASGLLLASFHNPLGGGFVELGWLAYPITVIYLAAFANIINLIDGLDGLAAGITIITSMTIFVFAVLTGRLAAAAIALGIAGACAGFLKENFHPATIFMGDSGALTLGFLLGGISLIAITRAALFVSLLVPILAAGVPVLDTAFAIFRRVRTHQPIDAPDRDHIHHRLLNEGFDQRTTVLIMWGWTAILAICGVLITVTVGVWRIPFFLIIVAVTGFGIYRLGLLRPVLLHHYNPRKRDRIPEEDRKPIKFPSSRDRVAGADRGAVEDHDQEDAPDERQRYGGPDDGRAPASEAERRREPRQSGDFKS